MGRHLDINAREISHLATKAQYAAMAAGCLESGPPTDPMEKLNCMMYLLEIAEDLAQQAARLAEQLEQDLQREAKQ
jgi:hypothetical protein